MLFIVIVLLSSWIETIEERFSKTHSVHFLAKLS